MGKQNVVGKDPMGEDAGLENGTSREGGRGYSQDSISQDQQVQPNPSGASFFGSTDGHNQDCQNKPEVKGPSKPTL